MKKIIILIIAAIILVSAISFYKVLLVKKSDHILTQSVCSTLTSTVKVGDLILRKGLSADSSVIMMLSHSNYSHIGIVTRVEPEIIITHATTDDDPKRTNQVIDSSVYDYLSENNASAGMVLRINNLNDEKLNKIVSIVREKLGSPYVLNKKDGSTKTLYCTVLIYNAILQVNPNFKLKWQNVTVPLVQGEYLFPQAFIDSTDTKVIFTF